MSPSTLRRRMTSGIALIGVFGLLAAACGGADDDRASDDTTPTGVADEDIIIEPEGEPVEGGKIVYGLEAETDGFNPVSNRWAIAGHQVALAVFDPLTALNADAEARPYLAESVEPNDDYTEWTITLRDGVTFHNGDPLTAEDVVTTLEAHQESILTSSALTPVESLEVVDDLTVQVSMNQPWVAFDAALTSQVGYVVHPGMLDGSLDEPNLNPVGTGPFEQQEWSPNTRWVGTKYEDYWREGLPYLDELEFRPIIEAQTRASALRTGEIDMAHTTNAPTIVELRQAAEAGEIQLVEDRGEGEQSFVLLNMESEPLDDVRVRQALAYATDTETFNEVTNDGITVPARGPFGPDSPWYHETDYPEYDIAAATELIDEYIADADTPNEVRITFRGTPTPETQRQMQFLAEGWADAGIQTDIETMDQASFIGSAISGDFQANLWRQIGAPDPDLDLVWWISEADGETNILNFPRMYDDEIDDALQRGRQNPDFEDRYEAYADFQDRMAELVPYVWLANTMWVVGASNDVRGITNGPLPDGEESYPLGGVHTFGGVHRLTQTWLER